MKIGIGPGFWKAALRITPCFSQNRPSGPARRPRMALSSPRASCVRSDARTGTLHPHRNFVASLIDPLIAFVSAHAGLAYLTLFLAALLEAVPIVGSVIPGSTIIFALSALVPGGELAAGVGAGSRDRWGVARRRIGVLDRISRPARDPQRLAVVELSARDRAERSLFPSLGHAGGFFRALRAADQSLRADHGGRAGDVAADVLRRQHSGDPAMGARPCAARRARGIGVASIWWVYAPCPYRRSITGCCR